MEALRPKKDHFSSFSILIFFLICSLTGLSLLPMLSIQLYPSRSYASVSVSCYMANASAYVTETELTTPLESALSRLKGIKKLSSSSGRGSASLTIDLDKWTDPELFRFEAAAVIRQLYARLPKDTSYPQIYLNRPNENTQYSSLIGYTINGPGTANDIAHIAEKIFKPAIANLKGIYRFEIAGADPEQISISADAQRMRTAGISYAGLAATIGDGLAAKELGLVNTSAGRFNITIDGNIKDRTDLASYPVAVKGSRVFTLSDVAILSEEVTKPSSYYRINGEDLISLNFYPETHINTIKLVDQIKTVMVQAEKRLPNGYHLALSYDNSQYIKDELGRIYFRTTLSVVLLLIFVFFITRQLRYMIIIIASLSVNILIAFIFYYLFRLEIHLYSIAGITISLGMVIDNVIVIVEDIRHTGRNRIFSAILSSTLISLGTLSVIFFLDEAHRITLLDFAFAIIINLAVSLPVAYFFIPALLDRFPVKIHKKEMLLKQRKKMVMFNRYYHILLSFMLKGRTYFFLLFILAFGLPVFLLPEKVEGNDSWSKVYTNIFGSDFYNQQLREPLNKYLGGSLFLFLRNQGLGLYQIEDKANSERTAIQLRITMPNGTSLEQMNGVCQEFDDYLSNFKSRLEVFTTNIINPNRGVINVVFKKGYEKDFPFQLKQLLESKAIMSGAADFEVSGIGAGFNNAISLEHYNSTITVKGYSFSYLQGIALKIADTLKQNPRAGNILITTADRWQDRPYHEYIANFTGSEYLNLQHASRWTISNALQTLQENKTVLGIIHHQNNTYIPLTLFSNKENIPTLWSTVNLPMQLSDTTVLRLKGVSSISPVKMGENIVKQDQTYLLNVHYQFTGSPDLNSLVKERIIKAVKKTLPFGYAVQSDDENGWGSGPGSGYLWFMPLVLLIVYIICTVLLESFLQPLAIVLMIPFSLIGVFLVFYVFGLKFDQGSYAALLMVAGLVTNGALYIINDLHFIDSDSRYTNRQRIKLYIKAFNSKVMPILITTATAILSMLPFMLNGEEKGFWFTLSVGTVGGLLFSLLGAFIFLPLSMLKPLKSNMKFKKLSKVW